MGQPLTIPPGFESLTVEEQLEFVQALWKRIGDQQRIPSPEWHRQVLRERLADHERNPQDVVPWEEVRAELRTKLERRR
jgi:putative addiction module component (TIGR02574 family)